METTLLYRSVGQCEYELIAESGFYRFPPRLSDQPFFTPVTNEEYATQIARDWNSKDAHCRASLDMSFGLAWTRNF